MRTKCICESIAALVKEVRCHVNRSIEFSEMLHAFTLNMFNEHIKKIRKVDHVIPSDKNFFGSNFKSP